MSIRVMSEFFGLKFGSSNRKAVAVRLADFADDSGRGIWPTVARVADDCELSVRTVQRILEEFVAEGMLVVVKAGGGRPGSSTRYDFDLVRVRARSSAIGETGDSVSPLPTGDNDAERGDSGDGEGCHGDTRTVIEPPVEPSSERAREREGGDDTPEAPALAERPGTAAFEKRVQRLCNGSGGYIAGPWKDWDNSSLGWIGKHFAALTIAERAEAERWRDAFLLDLAGRKTNPPPIGVWLRDKAWTALDLALLERADRQRQRQLQPAERAQPDGWAACLGNVGMAKLFADLLAGPPGGAVEPGTLWFENQLRQDWPAVHQWKQLQQSRGGTVFGERWHALKGAMEAVPAETETHAAWKALFAGRGWPWLSPFDGHPVLWAPKGGPAGLDHFEQMVRA